MPRSLFQRIMHDILEFDPWFQRIPDCTGKLGAFTLQKMVAAFCMLAYGTSGDSQDDYCKISETTAIEAMKRFCKAIIALHASEYLRELTALELKTIMKYNSARGFPGLFASLDCMVYEWKILTMVFVKHG
jgi:hypothetical protein